MAMMSWVVNISNTAPLRLKEYDKSIEYLVKAKEIYPSWARDWVDPILEKIEVERNPC